jgi:hypothetical protein
LRKSSPEGNTAPRDFPNDRDRRAGGRALVLSTAGDVKPGVADDAGQDVAQSAPDIPTLEAVITSFSTA